MKLTAACAVMCVHPTIFAPSKGFSFMFRFRNSIRPGISARHQENKAVATCNHINKSTVGATRNAHHIQNLPGL